MTISEQMTQIDQQEAWERQELHRLVWRDAAAFLAVTAFLIVLGAYLPFIGVGS
jgi:hypothetical protein